MNDDQLGQFSRQLADAPVPDAVRQGLARARMRAVAQAGSANLPWYSVLTLSRHPLLVLSSLALVVALSLSWWSAAKPEPALDVALLSSEVSLDDLLDSGLLAETPTVKVTP